MRVRTVLAVAAVLAVTACSSGHPGDRPSASGSTAAATASGSATAPAAPLDTSGVRAATDSPPADASSCPLPSTGFSCALQQRIATADAYAHSRPGTVGFVVRDRQTGAVYRNDEATTAVWTASTIKLAMTIALYQWDDSGRITLTAANRSDIAAMLHSSDDDAADRLWYAYADSDGSEHEAYNHAFATFGMTHLVARSGFTNYVPYWGFQQCTPEDLDALDQYLLTQVPAAERDSIVSALQQVDPDQQWGVWGAGAAAAPGNKDGWSQEQSGWVMNSVGFVGPGQRYTLAVMNSLDGQGDYDTGRQTDTQLAADLFTGLF